MAAEQKEGQLKHYVLVFVEDFRLKFVSDSLILRSFIIATAGVRVQIWLTHHIYEIRWKISYLVRVRQLHLNFRQDCLIVHRH